MIIDLILDRKDDEVCIEAGFTHYKMPNGELIPLAYDAHKFYREVMEYSSIFHGIGDGITAAMDYGEEEDVRREICKYIIDNDYNPEICAWVNARNWLE